MKSLLPSFVALLLLVGCAGGSRPAADTASYDLGPATALPAGGMPNAGIAVEVHMPLWLDGIAMNYRLAYVDPQRLYSYAHARWAGAPSRLVQQKLWQQLGMAPGGAPCTLRVELGEFTQIFDAADRSRVLVSGEATLQGKGRAVIAHLPLRVEAPAGSDARSGAAALAVATRELSERLATWLDARRGSCPAPN